MYLSVVLPKAQNLVNFNDLAFDYNRSITNEIDFAFLLDDAELDQLSIVEKAMILDIALLFGLSISHFFTLASRGEELQPRYDEIIHYFHKLEIFSKDISPSLEKALNNLKLPHRNADLKNWEAFENRLRDITIQHNDIGHQWSLTETNINSLRKYLVANSIILDAIPIAYIDNRKQVLEKIFKKLNA
jgi:6-pyruvoyl-tetrahydropterin synthase